MSKILNDLTSASTLLDKLTRNGLHVFHSPERGTSVVIADGCEPPSRETLGQVTSLDRSIGLKFCLDMVESVVDNKPVSDQIKASIVTHASHAREKQILRTRHFMSRIFRGGNSEEI